MDVFPGAISRHTLLWLRCRDWNKIRAFFLNFQFVLNPRYKRGMQAPNKDFGQ